MLRKKERPERSKINFDDAQQMKSWAHRLGVSPEDLRQVVEKVGNAAAEVRKELAR
jgi:hypothetical protein